VLTRLLIGLLKGLVLGGLVGYGLAAAGLTWGWLAYAAAAVTGLLVALFAGKPIWAPDARIEVGMKATVGALLAPLLLLAVRSFLTMGLPFDPSTLPGLESLATEGLTLGTFSVTALALVAAALGGFYDADNSPEPKADNKAAGKKSSAPAAKRIEAAAPDAGLAAAELEAAEAEAAQRKRRS
jgi:hypothetical protein